MKTRLDIPGALSARFLWISIALVCLAVKIGAQVPASFQVPILGYIFGANTQGLHPIVGIPGNSRIDRPLDLGFSLRLVEILPGHRHIIAASPDVPNPIVVDLQNRSIVIGIDGAPSDMSSIRTSADGRSAAFYYQSKRSLLIVGGLPETPVIQDTIDLSFVDHSLSRYSITDDGKVALLAFSDEQQDFLYRWEKGGGRQFLATSGKVADMTFIGNDVVVADASGPVVIFRNIQEQTKPTLVADSREGLSQPVAVSISKRNEILVADAGARTVFILDANGQLLRSLPCGCLPSGLWRLGDYTYQLTDRLDQPVILFDDSSVTPRILFVPAFSSAVEALQ